MSYHNDSFPGRELQIAGKRFLYFGGTSYLGLQTDPDFQQLFIENLKRYGTNYGASRKSNIQIPVFDAAESALATFVGSEASLTLSSGYLAGQLVAQYFTADSFQSVYAPNTHSALGAKNSVALEHLDALGPLLEKMDRSKTAVLFLDAVDTEGGRYPDFSDLNAIDLSRLILVVDDSHGIGIMGPQGEGAYGILQDLGAKELLVCCSLGKGFGIQAGAIFGSQARIDHMKETDIYGGASPATPAALATFLDGRPLFAQRLQRLRTNLRLFLSETGDKLHALRFIAEHPVFSFENAEFVSFLEQHGVLLTNFRYPNEKGSLVSRIVISAAHTPKDILYLAKLINSYF